MTHIRGILFDLDNTLVDREASIRSYAEVFHREFGHLLPIGPESIAKKLIVADSGGYKKKADMLATISSWPEWQSPPEMSYIDRHWMWEFPPIAVPMDKMIPTIEVLAGRGIKLGIITNGSARAQNAKIMALHLWRYFPVILVSETVGLRKPDPRLFRMAVEKLELSPDEVGFVGDHPEVDINGAERAGLTGIWLSGFHPWPGNLIAPIFQIQRLSDILELF